MPAPSEPTEKYRIRFREVHTYEIEVDAPDAVAALAQGWADYSQRPYADSVEFDDVLIDRATQEAAAWVEIGLSEAEMAEARARYEGVEVE